MTTSKSPTMKKLEKIAGRPLTLGGLLESVRLSEELPANVFAKMLDISASHLCDIEKGRKAVSPARAALFAKTLGRSEAQFIRLAIQDDLNRSGLKYKVVIAKAS